MAHEETHVVSMLLIAFQKDNVKQGLAPRVKGVGFADSLNVQWDNRSADQKPRRVPLCSDCQHTGKHLVVHDEVEAIQGCKIDARFKYRRDIMFALNDVDA